MTLISKFKKDLHTLKGAAAGDFFLDVKNPNYIKKSDVIMKMKV